MHCDSNFAVVVMITRTLQGREVLIGIDVEELRLLAIS